MRATPSRGTSSSRVLWVALAKAGSGMGSSRFAPTKPANGPGHKPVDLTRREGVTWRQNRRLPMTPDDLMFKPGLLNGQRILITGGGTGLGKVMAEGFLMLGATVYICGRRGGVLEETAGELMAAHGGKAVPIACDIRVPEAIGEMLDTI